MTILKIFSEVMNHLSILDVPQVFHFDIEHSNAELHIAMFVAIIIIIPTEGVFGQRKRD